MESPLNCFIRKLKCAFGPYPCFVCCIRNSRESTTTRLFYSAFLATVAILSTALHEGGIRGIIYQHFRNEMEQFCGVIDAGPQCYRLGGFIGIYRLCLPLSFFHILMALLTIGVSTSQCWRGKIHNGFWFWKIAILISTWILMYAFPVTERPIKVWMLLGIVGGVVFIYVQHITLIDFAYEINGIWHAKARKRVAFSVCIYVTTILLYLATIGAYAIFVLYYGLPYHCTVNLSVTGINASLTLLLAICSVFSQTLRRQHLWLPGAVTSAFVAFLTWSALSSQPRVLSSNAPWQKNPFSRDQSNTTAHPLLIVADQLNGLLSEQFVASEEPTVTEDGSKQVEGPTTLINQCLPGVNAGVISEHLGKDLVTFVGLFVVIGGLLYSSFRATMQARRLGIRTRREKLKALLPPLPECPEPDDDMKEQMQSSTSLNLSNPEVSPATAQTKSHKEQYLDMKEVKRQEKALDLLASAVVNLPNPKIFRRPSARQPANVNVSPSSSPFSSPSPKIGSQTECPKSGTENSFDGSAPATTFTSNASPPLKKPKGTLRLASSVPDLTLTGWKPRQRADLKQLDWSTGSQRDLGSSQHEIDSRHLPCSEAFDSENQLKVSKHETLRQRLKAFGQQTHWPKTLSRRTHYERRQNGPVKHKAFKQSKNGRKAFHRMSSVDDAQQLRSNLASFSPDRLPERTGSNPCLIRQQKIEESPSDLVGNMARRSLILSNHSGTLQSKMNTLSAGALEEDTLLNSPRHLRFQHARWASELAVSRRTSRLLETEPGLAASFAFLGPMLSTAAPRDGYVLYNEAIASVYSYPWFHFIYAIATLYLMAQLTNWYNPQISRVDTLSESWANLWMKLASSWLALALYAWTIVCPRLCIGRRLAENPLAPRTPRSVAVRPVSSVFMS